MTLLLQKDYVPLKPLMMVNISFAMKYFLIKMCIMLFKCSFLVSFWLCWVFVAAGFSQIAASRAHRAVAAPRLLPAPSPLAAEQEHGLQGSRASVAGTRGLSSCGFRALEHSLSG